MSLAGIATTTNDQTDYNNDVIPRDLRVNTAGDPNDPVHLNGTGYTLVANAIYAWLLAHDPGIGQHPISLSALASIFNSPPAIGSTNPYVGTFTNLTVNGTLGIGTSTPVSKLGLAVNYASNVDDGLLIDTYSGLAGVGLKLISSNTGVYRAALTSLISNSEAELLTLSLNGSGNIGISTSSPKSKLSVSGGASVGADYNLPAPANGILVEGAVGIGTTSPATTFSLAGHAYLTGGLGVGVLNSNSGTLQTSGAATIGGALAVGGTANARKLTVSIANSANVNDGLLLVRGGVTGTDDLGFKLKSDTNGSYRGAITSNADGTETEVLTITRAKNIAVGTTTTYAKLTVWGPDTASSSAFAVVNNASTTVFSVYDNGNATYSGSLFQSSDQRLKTDITPLDASSSLAAIEALTPVSYTRIDQPEQGTNLGFIAQAVQAIFPELVSVTPATSLTPDGTFTLNYVGLISPIVGAIQALDGKITALASAVSGFAQNFATETLTADNATFGQVTSQQDTTQKLCVGSTCVTPAQFQAIVSGAGQSSSAPSVSTPPASTTGTTSTSPDTATSTATSTTDVPSIVPDYTATTTLPAVPAASPTPLPTSTSTTR